MQKCYFVQNIHQYLKICNNIVCIDGDLFTKGTPGADAVESSIE